MPLNREYNRYSVRLKLDMTKDKKLGDRDVGREILLDFDRLISEKIEIDFGDYRINIDEDPSVAYCELFLYGVTISCPVSYSMTVESLEKNIEDSVSDIIKYNNVDFCLDL